MKLLDLIKKHNNNDNIKEIMYHNYPITYNYKYFYLFFKKQKKEFFIDEKIKIELFNIFYNILKIKYYSDPNKEKYNNILKITSEISKKIKEDTSIVLIPNWELFINDNLSITLDYYGIVITESQYNINGTLSAVQDDSIYKFYLFAIMSEKNCHIKFNNVYVDFLLEKPIIQNILLQYNIHCLWLIKYDEKKESKIITINKKDSESNYYLTKLQISVFINKIINKGDTKYICIGNYYPFILDKKTYNEINNSFKKTYKKNRIIFYKSDYYKSIDFKYI